MQKTFLESFRLSPQQHHLCALLQAEQSLPYQVHYAVRLSGSLDLSRLHEALERLVERHEILRTTFPRLPGLTLPVQVIHEKLSLPLEIHDYYLLSPHEQEEALWQLRQAQRHRPFPQERTGECPVPTQDGPLWQVTLVICDAKCHWLLWDLSALLADVQTCYLLLHELSQLYARGGSEEEELSEPLQYADLTEWQYELLNSVETATGRAYWRLSEEASLFAASLPYERSVDRLSPGKGTSPISANLKTVQGRDGTTDDREGREGVNPSTTHLCGEGGARCVDEELASSRPLRSLGSHTGKPALKFASIGTSPLPGSLTMSISPVELARLVVVAQDLEATSSAVLLACWGIVLSRLCGQTDLFIGTGYSGRKYQEVADAIGPLAKSLPLRYQFPDNARISSVVRQIEATMREAEKWQEYFGWQSLGQSHNGLQEQEQELFCAFGFNYEILPPPWQTGALQWIIEEQEAYLDRFKLSLSCLESLSGLQVRLHFDQERFAQEDMQRVLTHWQTVLRQVLASRDMTLGTIQLLTHEERQQQLQEWNATQADYPQDQCLHQYIEQQVEQTPDAIALIFDDVSYGFTPHVTYQQLNDQANQLAARLQALGVGPEVLVGVCMERSLELVVTLLAILKAGGAYVPLDPQYPKERLQYLIQDTQMAMIICRGRGSGAEERGSLTDPSSPVEVPILWLDATKQAEERPDTASPLVSTVIPENAAYVIYTSGSTGQPKGVVITHRSICNHIYWKQLTYVIDSTDRVLQRTPYSFDASVWEFFLPLLCGATLVLTSPEGYHESSYLTSLIREQQVTVAQFVPAVLQLFIADPSVANCTSLRQLFSGGEALSSELQKEVFSRLYIPLHNLYGPTEATIDSTSWTCRREGAFPLPAWAPLGRPISNVQVYLLDKNLQPVPVGVPAELYIGGVNLARGYWNRADLTAERFIPHPEGARIYRTGDLARYQPDGTIEYLGRIDQQVKLRGLRIELGEIEAVLRAHPSVRECVVVLREEEEARKVLVAYVVAQAGDSSTAIGPSQAQDTTPMASPEGPTAPALQEYLRERLPDYMVPSRVVILESLPLLPNGKVDRKSLPAPTASLSQASFAAPRSEVEQTLVTIWQQVLGTQTPIGIYDNFFALGGDSILSMQIVGRARQAGIGKLTAKQLFQHQTIAQLATIAIPVGSGIAPDLRLREQAEVTGPVPLTPIQRWFFEQNLPQPQHFNQAVLLQIHRVGTGLAPVRLPTPTISLQRHLQQIVDTWLVQHDALRMRYTYTETGWQQRLVSVAEAGSVTVELVDLTQVAASEQARVIEDVANGVQASLDLTHGPLLRTVLFDLGHGQPARLLIVIHHLAVDGVSWRVLLSDMQIVMNGASLQPTVTTARTVPFQRWAEYVQDLAQSTFQEDRAYWLKAAQVPTVPLPVEQAHRLHDCVSERCNIQDSARTVSTALTTEETRLLLQDAPQLYRSHIQELLLVALLQTLARWIGTQQIRLDLEGHGREELGAETLDVSRTVGWFTSLYPVLFTLPQESDIGSWIKTIKAQLRSVPHKGISYGLLRYCGGDPELREQLASASPSQVGFNYLGQFDQMLLNSSSSEATLQAASESSGAVSGPQNQRSHLLDVDGLVIGGQLHLQWTYSEQFHQQATIETLAQEFLQALRELLAHCRESSARGLIPSDFPLASLDQASLDRLVAGRENLIEDIYPLTPLQQGILFHTLYAPRSGVYLGQMSWLLRGEFEVGAFERAWQQVIAEHTILRTAFVWQELTEPLQIVFQQVKLPLNILDWRNRSPEQQEAELAAFLQADRAQGFDVGQAPLMRLTLVRLSETRTQVIWTHHHLLLDGWSVSLVLQEVLDRYAAEQQGLSLQYEERRPYRDYISWLQEQGDQSAEAYWRQTLAGIATPTPLGVDRRSLKHQSVASGLVPQVYAEEVLQVESQTTAQWQEYARRQRITLNTLVQAAWALILSRYSGQEDVVFGNVVAGRPPELAGVEHMTGLFINTLPVRVQVHDDDEVGAWLKQLQEQQLTQQSYEYSSLLQVQGWCRRSHRAGPDGRADPDGWTGPDGMPREHELFESLLVFENYPVQVALAERKSQSLEVEAVQIVEQTNYPLTILVVPGARRDLQTAAPYDEQGLPLSAPQPLLLRVSYNCQRFERATIERMLGHIYNCLQQLVASPEQKLAEISILTEREHKQTLLEWNETTRPIPADLCAHQLFEQQVEHTPDAIAMTFGDDVPYGFTPHLTYQQLNDHANQLAYRLQQEYIGPEGLVGVCLERSLELVVTLLAILKAGGTYVPLDPLYPTERLQALVEDAQIAVVISEHSFEQTLSSVEVPILWLDTIVQPEAKPDRASPAGPTVLPENIAYVIYTSGSTGRPKGAMVTQRGMLNHLFAKIDTLQLKPTERIAQTASQCFDISIWQFLAALLVGGQVCILPNETAHDPGLLFTRVKAQGITVLELVPSLLATALDHVIEQDEPRDSVRRRSEPAPLDLHWMLVTGEACPTRLVNRWEQCYPQIPLVNAYGPTECSDDVTHAMLLPTTSIETQSAPIGSPIINTQIYILDAHMRPLPIGVPGEIYVGGMGVGRGYLYDPVRTAQAFVPNPFVSEGERLYRTGDVGRYLHNGQIEFIGRIDHQIKIRGYRIELGEIEAVLSTHPSVRECVVVLQEESAANKYLVAYVALESRVEQSLTSGTSWEAIVRGYLHERLPDYMIPAFVVFLETLPLTPNGKIDRKALPVLDRSQLPQSTEMAPQTPLQEHLALLWAELLFGDRRDHKPQIGIHDNFFELGGHSLTAIQLMTRLRTLFQVEILLRRLFETPTIAELELVIEQIQSEQIEQAESEELTQVFSELSEDEIQALFTD
jgi:amino acid adenylation domain-containing protein/non-ribosomal peptide synthase protein (TIGR01720 family)